MYILELELSYPGEAVLEEFDSFVDTAPFVYALWHRAFQNDGIGVLPGTVLQKHLKDSQCPEEFILCAPFMGMTGDCVHSDGDSSSTLNQARLESGFWAVPDGVRLWDSYRSGAAFFVTPRGTLWPEYSLERLWKVSILTTRRPYLRNSYNRSPPGTTIGGLSTLLPNGLQHSPDWMRAPIIPEGTEVILPTELFLEYRQEMETFPIYTPMKRDRHVNRLLSLPTEPGEVVLSGFSKNRMTQFSKVVWPDGNEIVIDSRILMWQDSALQRSPSSKREVFWEEAQTHPELF